MKKQQILNTRKNELEMSYMVSARLMWLIWQERKKWTFEDIERPLDLLWSLLFGTLFNWACIWGFTHCISIADFLHVVSFSSWSMCICFMFRVFIIMNVMFIFFSKSLITYKKKYSWSGFVLFWQHKLGRGHRDKLQQFMTITGAR